MSDILVKRRTRELKSNVFRQSLHGALTDRLRTMILTQELKPGDRINELELSDTLGVSRTPMRESLKVLASENLVTLFPFRGAVVSDLSPDLIEHAFEVQGMIEHFAHDDKASYFEINQTLHKMLVSMSHNPCLVETHATVMRQIERARYAALGFERRWERSVDQHNDILRTLKTRDEVRMPQLVSQHVLETGRLIVAALRDLPDRSAQRDD